MTKTPPRTGLGRALLLCSTALVIRPLLRTVCVCWVLVNLRVARNRSEEGTPLYRKNCDQSVRLTATDERASLSS
jgi:hypothetical protein